MNRIFSHADLEGFNSLQAANATTQHAIFCQGDKDSAQLLKNLVIRKLNHCAPFRCAKDFCYFCPGKGQECLLLLQSKVLIFFMPLQFFLCSLWPNLMTHYLVMTKKH